MKWSLKEPITNNVSESFAKKEDVAGWSTFFRSLFLWELASTDSAVVYLLNNFWHLD